MQTCCMQFEYMQAHAFNFMRRPCGNHFYAALAPHPPSPAPAAVSCCSARTAADSGVQERRPAAAAPWYWAPMQSQVPSHLLRRHFHCQQLLRMHHHRSHARRHRPRCRRHYLMHRWLRRRHSRLLVVLLRKALRCQHMAAGAAGSRRSEWGQWQWSAANRWGGVATLKLASFLVAAAVNVVEGQSWVLPLPPPVLLLWLVLRLHLLLQPLLLRLQLALPQVLLSLLLLMLVLPCLLMMLLLSLLLIPTAARNWGSAAAVEVASSGFETHSPAAMAAVTVAAAAMVVVAAASFAAAWVAAASAAAASSEEGSWRCHLHGAAAETW